MFAAIAAGIILMGCGAGGGDTATFEIGGATVSVTESGTTTIHVDNAPEMDYNGPLGCGGRYFTTEFPEGIELDFRYSAHDAYLLQGAGLYHMGPPTRVGATLRWHENVGGDQLGVQVDCPLPPASVPAVSALAAPSACSLLTRRLAVSLLGPQIGRADTQGLGPPGSYCDYETPDHRFVNLDVESAQLLESEKLWTAPPIEGLGVPAHDASRLGGGDGLVVVKGAFGFEAIANLGFSLNDAARDLAAEERIAREILPQLPAR